MGDETGSLRENPVQEVVEQDGALIVRLAGELDLYNAEVVRGALGEAAVRAPERLVVDLGEVSFLDSTALGVLIEARGKLENRSGFLLAAPGLEARRALEVSGLDRHFELHETVDGALSARLA
ncbi:MAG: STAS domain-containing protein [Thermoleophilia bacterium]|nr:STAS domain-containing protein [Thermoleophilia bacterium]